jgi:hypothetical protein
LNISSKIFSGIHTNGFIPIISITALNLYSIIHLSFSMIHNPLFSVNIFYPIIFQ